MDSSHQNYAEQWIYLSMYDAWFKSYAKIDFHENPRWPPPCPRSGQNDPLGYNFFLGNITYSLTGLSEDSKKVVFDIDSLNH